jgi:hypothetical protein
VKPFVGYFAEVNISERRNAGVARYVGAEAPTIFYYNNVVSMFGTMSGCIWL